METRVFVFDMMGPDRLAEQPRGGSGTIKYLDDYRAEGWRPIHWDDISPASAQIIRYRVIMERQA